jgi:hypothetical protein
MEIPIVAGDCQPLPKPNAVLVFIQLHFDPSIGLIAINLAIFQIGV